MRNQPHPDSRRWPWNSVIWGFHQAPAARFATVHISERVRDGCTLCSAMIFPGELACEVVLLERDGWRMLHFHQHCYADWECR